MGKLIDRREFSPKELAGRVFSKHGSSLIFIGGGIKGAFFKNFGTDEIAHEVYTLLNEGAKAGMIKDSEILTRYNRTIALLKKICKLNEVKNNPTKIQDQIRRRLLKAPN